ncbi:uncharacterized protein METZ01_LOCUS392980, partial [marine metagenome]
VDYWRFRPAAPRGVADRRCNVLKIEDAMTKDVFTLTSPDGQTTELPVRKGTTGPDVIDIGQLFAERGVFTYDPGFFSTGSCDSKITYINGKEGVLMYRGYRVEQLAEYSSFIEVAYLLLYGELPTANELS